MGVVFASSACFGCGNIFFYNPMRVPSIPINGVKEPICLACVEQVNSLRAAKGLEPIVPLPDAYGVCDESELGD